jgi:phage recombination protein Bet
MSAELATTEQASTDYSSEDIQLIKETVAKDCTPAELKLFLYTCKRTGLDPLVDRQIYAIKRRDNRLGRDVMTIQTGIDGYRLVADRTQKYAGNDEAVLDNEKNPQKATVTIWKLVEGVKCAFTASARWDEYYPGDGKEGFFWRKMPCTMLGKCAEALALRKGFPRELSGVYIKEEMDQAVRTERSVSPKAKPELPAAADQNEVIVWEDVTINGMDEIHSKPGVPKPWVLFVIKTSAGEAKTFNKKDAEAANEQVGREPVNVIVRPNARRPGEFEYLRFDKISNSWVKDEAPADETQEDLGWSNP